MPEDDDNFKKSSKPKKDEDRVFDVTKPGKTEPDASSRPLIIGHRTLLKQDPMVKAESVARPDRDKEVSSGTAAEDESSMPENKNVQSSSFTQTKIEPPADELKAEEPKVDNSKADMDKKTVESEKEIEPSPTTDVNTNKEPQNTDTNDLIGSDPKPPETQVSQPEDIELPGGQTKIKKPGEKVISEEAAHQEALEKLITEKKYALPIGQKTRTRTAQLVLIAAGVIAGLVIVWLLIR